MVIYRHPPRTRHIKLSENIHSLIFNKSADQNAPIYIPTAKDKTKYGYNEDSKFGFTSALIKEVIKNGYKYDLCLRCKAGDHCKHDVYHSQHSILKVVENKMKDHRHKLLECPLNLDNMLALILYTGLIFNMYHLSDVMHVDYMFFFNLTSVIPIF